MKELSSSIVRLIQFVEYYLCPQYCGVVDRRRVIAYLFTTLIELIIIPFHFFLFLMVWEPSGFAMVCLHLVTIYDMEAGAPIPSRRIGTLLARGGETGGR